MDSVLKFCKFKLGNDEAKLSSHNGIKKKILFTIRV